MAKYLSSYARKTRKPNYKKKTLRLINDKDNIEINFVWFKSVGVWTNRNQNSQKIARLMVRHVQGECLHNRRKMSYFENWAWIIATIKKEFNLTEESEDL
jgi:hypothetical protein